MDTAADESPQARGRVPARPRSFSLWSAVPWIIAVAAIGEAVWALRQRNASRDLSPIRFAIDVAPAGQELRDAPAVSPDGKTIAYVATTGSVRSLFLRTLDDLEAVAVPKTEALSASAPFFSPDGRWIAFFAAAGGLMKVQVAGGPPVPVASTSVGEWGASWSRGDNILIGAPSGLLQVAGAGGTPRPAIKAGAGETVANPLLLPDGNTVLFVVTPAGEGDENPMQSEGQVGVGSLSAGDYRKTSLRAVKLLGIVSGWLVFTRSDGTLLAVPIDLTRGEAIGDPVTLFDGIGFEGNGAALSESGTLAYVRGSPQRPVTQLVVVHNWTSELRARLLAAPRK